MELTDLRKLLSGALVEHKASECMDRCVERALPSHKLSFRGFNGWLNLFEYSLSFGGFRIR